MRLVGQLRVHLFASCVAVGWVWARVWLVRWIWRAYLVGRFAKADASAPLKAIGRVGGDFARYDEFDWAQAWAEWGQPAKLPRAKPSGLPSRPAEPTSG